MKNVKNCILRFDKEDYPDKEKLLNTISQMLDYFESDEVLASLDSNMRNTMCKGLVIEVNYPIDYKVIPQLNYQEFLRLSDLPF